MKVFYIIFDMGIFVAPKKGGEWPAYRTWVKYDQKLVQIYRLGLQESVKTCEIEFGFCLLVGHDSSDVVSCIVSYIVLSVLQDSF